MSKIEDLATSGGQKEDILTFCVTTFDAKKCQNVLLAGLNDKKCQSTTGPAGIYGTRKLTEAGHVVVLLNRDIKPKIMIDNQTGKV